MSGSEWAQRYHANEETAAELMRVFGAQPMVSSEQDRPALER
ncbi:hypothetical protein [Catenulispora yoronensis]